MFYIVRVYHAGGAVDYEYPTQAEADAHMQTESRHAELYVWLGGVEKFMYQVN